MLVPFFLFSCEYTPIYSNKNDYNFSFEKINFEGNSEINNLVEKKLIRFLNRNVNKKFIITTNSSYKKISQSKNLTGKTTDYLITIEIIFKIEKGNEKINISRCFSFSSSLDFIFFNKYIPVSCIIS